MKFTEIKTNSYHFFTGEDCMLYGEYKTLYSDGTVERHCFYKGDSVHGEYKAWDVNGGLIIWSLDIGRVELLCFTKETGFVGAKKQIAKLAHKHGLPLLKDTPVDRSGEEMLMWELKYPNMPLLPI